jgi:hypothetical protein
MADAFAEISDIRFRASQLQPTSAVAQAGQKCDPGLETTGNLANVGSKLTGGIDE